MSLSEDQTCINMKKDNIYKIFSFQVGGHSTIF